MEIEVLISTMNKRSFNFINEMNIKGNCLIINQTNYEKKDYIYDEINKRHIKFLSFNEKGLSKSRNKAIENSTADICVIADDDLVYNDNYLKIIREAYLKYNDADLIIFDVPSTNTMRPDSIISTKTCKIGYLKSLKVSSYKITFKRESILNNKIRFDELFGAGSVFNSGEENIFLFDCLKKGLNIYYIPIKIATVSHETSTWFNGFNRNYFRTKGALSNRLFKCFDFIFILQFAIRKYRLYYKEISIIKAISYMCEGRTDYKQYVQKQHGYFS